MSEAGTRQEGRSAAAPGPLVGRRAELETFRTALARVARGSPGVLHVSGEIGIGRTRLLNEFMAAARATNARCLLTRPAPRNDEPLGALRHADLTGPLPAFARALAAPPPDKDRLSTLLDAVAADARDGPVWLLVDDLQAADEATSLFVRQLVSAVCHGSLRKARIGLTVSTVGAEPPPLPPLQESSSDVRIQRRMLLERLTPDEVGEWLEGRFDARPEQALVQRLTDSSGGNPLLLTELIVFLHHSGLLQVAGGRVHLSRGADELKLPQDLTALLEGKLAAISSECRRAMTLAAFLGHQFDLLKLADLSGMDAAGVGALVDEAETASLVERRGANQVSFKHSTARNVIYASPDLSSREETHLRICKGLIGEFGDDANDHCLAITHHLLGAGSRADDSLVLRYAPLAAEIAFRHHSYFLAGRYFSAAAASGANVLPASQRAELYTRAGEAFQRWSDATHSNTCFRHALELYEQEGDRVGYARALQGQLRNYIAFGEDYDTCANVAARLQGLIGSLPHDDAELEVRVHDTLAAYYLDIARYDTAETYARTAMTAARQTADPELRCIPVTSLALAQMEQLRLAEAKTTWLEGLSYDRAAGATRYEGLHLQRLPVPLYCLGEIQEASRYNQASYRHNEAIGNTGELSINLTVDVMIANVRGEFETAIRTGREALELVTSTRYLWSVPSLIGALAYALTMRERFDEAEQIIAHLALNGLIFADTGPYRATASRLSELVAAHRARSAPVTVHASESDDRRLRGVRLGSLSRLCNQVELALLQRRPERLSEVHDALEYVHRRQLALALGWCGSLARSLAVSTALRHGLARASEHFAEASKLAERMNAPLEQARVELFRGLVTLTCSEGNRDDARRDLTSALGGFERHSAPALARLAANALDHD